MHFNKAMIEMPPRFAAAYGGDGESQMTPDKVAKALASVQRTLNTPNSPFYRYLRGDLDAMSVQQKRGMAAFADTACHRGPALADSLLHRIQMPGSTDVGRFQVTGNEADKYAFDRHDEKCQSRGA